MMSVLLSWAAPRLALLPYSASTCCTVLHFLLFSQRLLRCISGAYGVMAILGMFLLRQNNLYIRLWSSALFDFVGERKSWQQPIEGERHNGRRNVAGVQCQRPV